MAGFLSQGLAPWVILADGPGGLICARICPGTLSRRWYANTLRRIGHEGGGRRAVGPLAVPVIVLICRCPSSAVSGNREPTYTASRALPSGTGSTGTHWPGVLAAAVSWRTRRWMRRAK